WQVVVLGRRSTGGAGARAFRAVRLRAASTAAGLRRDGAAANEHRASGARLASWRHAQRSARPVQGPSRRQARALQGRRQARSRDPASACRPQAAEEKRRRMIAHVVLLQPKPGLSDGQRAEALETLRRAAANLPDVRRSRLGRRVKHGLPGYEQLMTQDFEFAFIIEVDDLESLKRYLTAP